MRSTCCLEGNSEARERKDLAGRITVQVVAAAAQAFGGLVQCVSFEGATHDMLTHLLVARAAEMLSCILTASSVDAGTP